MLQKNDATRMVTESCTKVHPKSNLLQKVMN